MSPSWPNWRPEHDLRAVHLDGLEDFLLTRSNLMESGLHGVGLFDYSTSMRLKADESKSLTLDVWNVRGVTPSGQPVVVAEDEILSQAVSLTNPQEPCVDVFLQVSQIAKDAPESKIWLDGRETEGGKKAPPIVPGKHPKALYLGRYSFDADGKPSIVHFPLVRRFCGFRPFDERWRSWTEPLRSSIEKWWNETHQVRSDDGLEMVLASEVAKLRIGWAVMPLNHLREMLLLAKALDQSRDSHEQALMLSDLQPFPRANEIGNSLPASLARVLAPVISSPLAEVLRDLLHPVTVRVPVRRCEEWAGYLSNLERFGVASSQDDSLLDDGVLLMLETRARSGKIIDDWTRLVALATIWTVRKYVEKDWGAEILSVYLEHPTDDVPMNVARLLERLISDADGNPEASPAAPFGIFRISRGLPKDLKLDIGRCGIRQVAEYLKMLERSKPPEKSGNRALNHVRSRWTDKPRSPVAVAPKHLPTASRPGSSGRAMTRQGDIRMVIVGLPGSGRTTLSREIIKLLREDTPLQIEGVRQRNLKTGERRGEVPSTDVRDVDIVIGRAHFGVSVIDTSGVDETESLLTETKKADLIVVTLPPEVIAGERIDLMQNLAGVVARATDRDRKPAVAVAYTKADEYGILDERGLRVFWSGKPFDAYYGGHQDWEAFLRRLKRTGIVVPPGAGRRGDVDPSIYGRDEWADTRAMVVNASQVLWEALLPPGGAARILNGYFVSSEPLDEFYSPPYRRGYGQMLADFFSLYDES